MKRKLIIAFWLCMLIILTLGITAVAEEPTAIASNNEISTENVLETVPEFVMEAPEEMQIGGSVDTITESRTEEPAANDMIETQEPKIAEPKGENLSPDAIIEQVAENTIEKKNAEEESEAQPVDKKNVKEVLDEETAEKPTKEENAEFDEKKIVESEDKVESEIKEEESVETSEKKPNEEETVVGETEEEVVTEEIKQPADDISANNANNTATSGSTYVVKFIMTTEEGKKICQFDGGSEEGISVKDILTGLDLKITSDTQIDVLEDSIDTDVIGLRRTENGLYIIDYGMFSKASKDLIITVNGIEIPIAVLDDFKYLNPTYRDNDVTKGVTGWSTEEVAIADDHILKTGTTTTTLTEGWWAVQGEVTTSSLTISGAVKLLLLDNAILRATSDTDGNAGICVSGEGNSLTIYAQSTDESKTGKLIATGKGEGAGIGGNDRCSGNNITINGGKIEATSGNRYGAGIGAGHASYAKNIIINGGFVKATAQSSGAGIGGGAEGKSADSVNGGYGSNITINGGTVEAVSNGQGAGIGGGQGGSGSYITINDGTVKATSYDRSAGIGCGAASTSGGNKTSGNNITINGGTVTATGGTNGGSGIGGAWSTSGSNITINGGTVTATCKGDKWGNSGAGIGGGGKGNFYDCGGNGSNITITGGIVTATGGTYGDSGGAGIGGGQGGSGSSITITGGTVIATGGTGAVGIGNGKGCTTSSTIKASISLSVCAGDSSTSTTIKEIAHETETNLAELSDFKKKYVIIHKHSWTFEVNKTTSDDDTIKASCACEECPLKDTTLTISASSTEYDGTSHDASFGSATSFIGKNLPNIEYFKINGTSEDKLSSAPTDVGNYKASFTIGTGNSAITAFVEYSILKKQLTVSGTSVNNKTYDGTTSATATIGTVEGISTGDASNVTVAISSASFSDASAGTGKEVTIEYSISGTKAGNYLAPQNDTSLKADITQKELNVNGTTVSSKTYDGTTSADTTIGTVEGVITGDASNVTVAISSAYFSDASAGTGKEVTIEYSISGTKAENYSISNGKSTADIAQKSGSNDTIEGVVDLLYNGSAQTQSNITVKDGDIEVDKTNYDVEYKNNTDPGTATVTVKFKNNYCGSVETTFKIDDATASLTYGGITTYYRTVQAAFDAAQAHSGAIEMRLNSVENIVVPDGVFTLELHGHTLSVSSGTVITNNGVLTLSDLIGTGNVTGGTIGVYNGKSLTLSNKAAITGNTQNIYLPSGKTVKVSNGYSGIVGITTQDKPTPGNPVSITEYISGVSGYLNCFTSDDAELLVFVDGNYIKLGVVMAEIDGNYYATVQLAIDNSKKDDVVILKKLAKEDITIGSGKELTLDLNGNVLNGSISVTGGGKLTIDDKSVSDTHSNLVGGVFKKISKDTNSTIAIKAGIYTQELDSSFIASGYQLIKNIGSAVFKYRVVAMPPSDGSQQYVADGLDVVSTDDKRCTAKFSINGTNVKIYLTDKDGNKADIANVKILKPDYLLANGVKTAEIRLTKSLLLIIDIEQAMCEKPKCVITIDNNNGIVGVSCDGSKVFATDIKDILDIASKIVYDGQTIKVYDAIGNIIKEFNII